MVSRILIVLTISLFSACPGNESSPDVSSDFSQDGFSEDVGKDFTPGTINDARVDLPDVDSDGDGLLDNIDNCPHVVNPEQKDRDRDQVGDLCDHFPFISDPTNPETITPIEEDETQKPNNSDAESTASYGALDLPLLVNTKVDIASDIDWYTFEITEPTALLLRFETNDKTWPAAIVVGRDLRNANIYKVLLSPGIGQASDREMFLAMPGKYAIVTSDTRNLVSSTADVGGKGFAFSLSLSELPLPKSEPASLIAGVVPQTFNGSLRVHKIDLHGQSAVFIHGQGVAVDANTFHNPAFTILDAENPKRVIAATGLAEVNEQKVSMVSQIISTSSILVVEDFVDRSGNATFTHLFQATPLDKELESRTSPANERQDLVPWLEIGSEIKGLIHPGDEKDEDFFLLTMQPGDAIRISVETKAGNPLLPNIDIGHWIANPPDGSFYASSHKSEAPKTPGEPTSVEYFFDDTQAGEVAIRLSHNGANPILKDHKYTLKIERWNPLSKTLTGLPQELELDIKRGSLGLVDIELKANMLISSFTTSDAISPDSRWTEKSNSLRIAQGSRQELTFRVPSDGVYRLDVRDFLGREGKTNLRIVSNTPKPLVLPGRDTSDLFNSPSKFYSFNANKGDVFDVRVHSENFFAQIKIFDSEFNRIGFGYEDEIFVAPTDGEYVVAISASDDESAMDRTFVLGVEKVNPTPFALGTKTSDVLDREPFADWFKINVQAGKQYEIYYASTGFRGALRVLEPRNFRVNSYGSDGVARWTAEKDEELWVSFAENDNDADPAFSYELRFKEVTSISISAGASVLGSTKTENFVYYDFKVLPGMVNIVVKPVGNWKSEIILLNAETNRVERDAPQIGNRIVFVQSKPISYRLAIREEDSNLIERDFTVEYTLISASGNIAEMEPNNDKSNAQILPNPPLGVNASSVEKVLDWYAISLLPGQRVWSLVSDRNDTGVNRFDAELFLLTPENITYQNRFSGEGYLPGLHGKRATKTGTYYFSYGSVTGPSTVGDYAIYFFTSDVQEVAEVEPNNNIAEAQLLPNFDDSILFAAEASGGDKDVAGFRVKFPATKIFVSLDGTAPGHNLRLMDSNGMQLSASGPGFDGKQDAKIEITLGSSGVYYIELSKGNSSSAARVVISKFL